MNHLTENINLKLLDICVYKLSAQLCDCVSLLTRNCRATINGTRDEIGLNEH